MKRRIAAALSILAVVGGVGWKLARQPETSTGLQEIRLDQQSERAQPGSPNALARIRVRLSPNDLAYQVRATADRVPQIALAE